MEKRRGVAGVYTASPELVPAGLRTWSKWYEAPTYLRNGHVHTIWAAKARAAPWCRYRRRLLATPDGGTLALDMLDAISDETISGVEIVEDEENKHPPLKWGRCLLLLSGLGGGSQDTYVRTMGAYAKARGVAHVAVLNMRSCGESPVTSPRFFSAYRGSTEDVALAVSELRASLEPSMLAAIGWSNSGTIVVNALAEGLDVDKACALAAPLDMPLSSANLERWFHSNVYDRRIGSSLAEKFREHRCLFLDAAGTPKPVPAWAGGTYVPDIDKATNATSIRVIDEAITAPCFGFPTVEAYYEFSSANQRLDKVAKPLLVVNAADDPIALWGDLDYLLTKVYANPNLVFAATDHGGHLGWCDAGNPAGAPSWIQACAIDFLFQQT
ncbi:hypothetical protein CTAYLR_007962 [Chrysophaeum taylorii]|uniref:AB hydrolase-1 domain-containing protein n=1 Tax=Chrysophaeum taylorii TaxID=2483200 RepID=A0AAD7XIV4_9STRA|nr:hypothetical protein CTAYLR_007962 [Chrysophaeum taylorii]